MAETGKLNEEEIFQCLKNFHVPVRMNDLKVPTREFIIRVFECFLKDLQVDITSPKLRSWEVISHIEHAEIYEEGELLILLAMSVNHITQPWDLNITLKDITDPKPKRTKKILNYLIVFWNYYLQKYARFHAMKEEYETERMKAQEVISEIESLDVKHNDLLDELKNMKPSIGELSSCVQEKDKKAAKLNAECTQLKNEYEALKTKEVDIKNQMGQTDVSIFTAKERLDELSQLILSSPDRINSEIQRLEDRIRNEDMKIKEYENRHKEFVMKLQLQEEAEKKAEDVLNTLNETKEIYDNLRDTVQSIVDVNENITEKESKVKRLEMDLARKEDWKIQQQQKSAKVFLNSKKQVETLTEVLKSNQTEEAKLRKKIEFFKGATKKLQAENDLISDNVLNVVQKMKEADAKSREREDQFQAKMKEISNQFKMDCEEVCNMLQKTFPNKSSRKSTKAKK